MWGKTIIVGIAFLVVSGAWAEAPVVEAQGSPANLLAMNEVPPAQQFVQRGQGSDAQPTQSPSLLLNKIEALEQEVQELRGKLEVQAHDLKLLNEQQQAFYKDLDSRLAKLAGTSNQTKPVAQTATASPATPPNQDKKTDNKEKPTAQAPAKQGDGEQSYTEAYNLIKQKHYTQAVSAMEAFLVAYPNSSYVANANYWLGELYLMQGHMDQALQAFGTVVQRFPESNKAAGAQLKIGFALYDKGQWPQARKALTKVTTAYPDTALARLAKERLQTMGRQGL